MIRTQQPPPFRRLQLRLELAARRTRQALGLRRQDLHTESATPPIAAPLPTSDMNSVPPADLPLSDPDAPRDYRAALLSAFSDYYTFEARFDELVQTLCLAAHEGPTPTREAHYQRERVWFVSEYARVKEDLAEYLPKDTADTATTPLGTQSCDAFEALFFPPSLADMLGDDQGELIDRLERTQNALNAWQRDLVSARYRLGY